MMQRTCGDKNSTFAMLLAPSRSLKLQTPYQTEMVNNSASLKSAKGVLSEISSSRLIKLNFCAQFAFSFSWLQINTPWNCLLGYKLTLYGIVDVATKHESLMLFLAGRTQHCSNKNCYFKCPETSEKRVKFPGSFP